MERFTANVILPEHVVLHREVASLRASGYAVSPLTRRGIVVQAEAPSLESFLADLEDSLHPDATIDDHGAAA